MENFKEVSLGFAEFVSQLIQETFDAIQSSNNYQIERYNELEKSLQISDDKFIEEFISDAQIEEKEIELFGFKVDESFKVDQRILDLLIEQLEFSSEMIEDKMLTKFGIEQVKSFVTNLLIEEKRNLLNQILNRTNLTHLVVDSGEINTKLELSNLYSTKAEAEEKEEETSDEKTSDEKTKSSKMVLEKMEYDERKLKKSDLSLFRKPMKISEVKDDITGKTTVMLDKSELINKSESNLSIPDVRLIAQPVKMTSQSNLFTEVKINFKMI